MGCWLHERLAPLVQDSGIVTHIAVIGAGIAGVTTAYALKRRGFEVTVIERHRYPAMETSFANGGQLSASNAEVWNHGSTILKALRWVLRRDAPLLLNLKPSWHKFSWLSEFVLNIGDYRQNTIATTRLACEARQHLLRIAAEERIEFDHEERGILHVYRSKDDFDHASTVSALLAEGGLDRRPLSAAEVAAIEPALHGQYYGGFFTASDSTGDIHKFTRGLALACAERGVRFVYGADADIARVQDTGVTLTWPADGEIHRLRADALVVCGGCESRSLAAKAGDRVNVYPVKGYSITVLLNDEVSREAAPWVSLLDDHAKIVTSRLGQGRFRVAGTAEINGFNRDIRADRIRPLVDWVHRHFPRVSTDAVIPWSGLRPMMPNMMPRVSQGRHSRVFYNTGHGHLGWTLSAGTAELVTDVIAARPYLGLAS